jgi:hypothetical protein
MAQELKYTTSDGQEFDTKNYADLHARSLQDKKVKEVSTIKATPLKTAEEIIAYVAECNDLLALDNLEGAEQIRGKSRKTVLAAINERIAQLTEEE